MMHIELCKYRLAWTEKYQNIIINGLRDPSHINFKTIPVNILHKKRELHFADEDTLDLYCSKSLHTHHCQDVTKLTQNLKHLFLHKRHKVLQQKY